MDIVPILSAVAMLAIMVVLDALWLGVIARRYYREMLSRLIAFEFRWLPACIFYLLHTLGLLLFVVLPSAAAPASDGATILLRGAGFGLFTYGTYDLTSMATIRGWPSRFAVVDILWGMLVSALTAMTGFMVTRWLGV